MERRTIRLEGDLHGVAGGAWRKAQALGLAGFVAMDGLAAATIEVEGPPPALDEFEAWARRGPLRATIATVSVASMPAAGEPGFRIIRDDES